MRSAMAVVALMLITFTAYGVVGLKYDFENEAQLSDWEFYKDDKGVWGIVDGKLRVQSGAGDGFGGITMVSVGDVDWTDYTFEATATRVAGNYPCFLVRIQDYAICYDFEASYGSSTLSVFKRTPGVAEEITPGARPALPAGDTHVYKIEVAGDTFKLYVDDELMMELEDDSYESGKVGFLSYGSSTIDYDDVFITGEGIGAVDSHGKLSTVWAAIKRY